MFYPEKMCKIRIFTGKENKKRIVEKLYELKVLHIKKYKQEDYFLKNAVPIKEFEYISEMFLGFSSALKKLEKEGISIIGGREEMSLEEVKKVYDDFINNVHVKLERIKEIEEEVGVLKARLEKIKVLDLLGIKDMSSLCNLKLVTPVIFSTKEGERVKRVLDKKLKNKEVVHYSYSKPNENKEQYFIVLISNGKEGVMDELSSLTTRIYDLSEFSVISKAYEGVRDRTKISALLKHIEKEIDSLSQEARKLRQDIISYINKNKNKISSAYNVLKREVDKHGKVMQFAESKAVFYIEGFIPCKEKERVVEEIKKVDDKVVIEIREIEKDAPTYLPHPKTISPFKFLLDIYSLPKYNSIDPTLFTTITFPIFYGFMLGDMGYGLVLLLFSLLLVRKTRKNSVFNVLAKIMIFASLSSIIFGAVFGEFFGAESIFGLELHPLLHRSGEILELIIISMLIGVFHVNLGLIIGFFNELKHKNYKHAFLEKLSWIILEIGGVYLAFAYFLQKPVLSLGVDKILSPLILLTSIYMLWKGEGPKGIFEIPGIFGNILSYARLAAIGLSSVALAFVVNKFAFPFFQKSPVYWIAGILILLVGHTFNIALGVIGPFLHSLRLHYVEFFTKFYEQGGEEYKPYGELEEGEEIKEKVKEV